MEKVTHRRQDNRTGKLHPVIFGMLGPISTRCRHSLHQALLAALHPLAPQVHDVPSAGHPRRLPAERHLQVSCRPVRACACSPGVRSSLPPTQRRTPLTHVATHFVWSPRAFSAYPGCSAREQVGIAACEPANAAERGGGRKAGAEPFALFLCFSVGSRRYILLSPGGARLPVP